MLRRLMGLGVVAALATLAACSATAPLPDYAGVPEVHERSADFALPLDDDGRVRLQEFLDEEGSDPQADYGAVLAVLASPLARFEDLESESSAFRGLAQPRDWAMQVLDARSGDDMDRRTALAIVHGEFVFAVYRNRMQDDREMEESLQRLRALVPGGGPEVDAEIRRLEEIARLPLWRRATATAGAPEPLGLVVYPAQFVRTKGAGER